jgi:hypothetical protein
MRGRVCNLLFLLDLTSAVPLESESHETQGHILLSQFLRLPQPGGLGPSIYIPQEQGGPWVLGSVSVASYDKQGYGGGVLSRLHTGTNLKIISIQIISKNAIHHCWPSALVFHNSCSLLLLFVLLPTPSVKFSFVPAIL